MRLITAGLIKLWRLLISPLYGNVCKYYPSCSAYGLEAVQLHGSIRGGILTIWRILRCNPFSKGGVDFVPGSPRWFLAKDEYQDFGDSRVKDQLNSAKPTTEELIEFVFEKPQSTLARLVLSNTSSSDIQGGLQ